MKFLCKVIASAALAFVVKACEQECTANPGTCVCASPTSPLEIEKTPQFISITFDDAVTPDLETNYIDNIFEGRSNPDSKPIRGTFLVPYGYTNYEVVNRLCNKGHEIGLNSVSKSGVDYWKNADANQIGQEFSDGRTIAATFGNVPLAEIIGARIPNLQVEGDKTFGGYNQAGLSYDNSCIMKNVTRSFPFNLDYPTNQECTIGSLPTESYPGMWVMPIAPHTRPDGHLCSSLSECQCGTTVAEISDWLNGQINVHYSGNRAPITLRPSKMWFDMNSNALAALQSVLDHWLQFPDVFIVPLREVLRWRANPTPLSTYTTNVVANACGTCDNPSTCTYLVNSEYRVIRVCGSCPETYPGLGNPEGTTPPPE